MQPGFKQVIITTGGELVPLIKLSIKPAQEKIMSNINTNLGHMTRQQLSKVMIMLRFDGNLQEEYSAHDILNSGNFRFNELQQVVDLKGESWQVPHDDSRSMYCDAKWAFVTFLEGVVGEEDDPNDELESDFSYELKAEAFARGGMQAVNDLYCSSDI